MRGSGMKDADIFAALAQNRRIEESYMREAYLAGDEMKLLAATKRYMAALFGLDAWHADQEASGPGGLPGTAPANKRGTTRRGGA